MFRYPFGELLVGSFFVITVCSALIAYKKYIKTPRLALRRYPLPETQKIQLQTAFATLLATGALRADDVTFQELVDCAETLDDFSARDCSEALVIFNVLNALQSQRRRFRNLTFIADQVDFDEHSVLAIVREFTRLAGRENQLRASKLKGIDGGEIVLARRGELPPDNAKVEFVLGSRRCTVPFVMYGKNIPLGLMETLPEILGSDAEPRRFFSAYFEAFLAVTYLSADQVATLNLAFSHQPDCFELLK
jgi:hypothetical protein